MSSFITTDAPEISLVWLGDISNIRCFVYLNQSGNQGLVLAPNCGSAVDDHLKSQTNKLEFSD